MVKVTGQQGLAGRPPRTLRLFFLRSQLTGGASLQKPGLSMSSREILRGSCRRGEWQVLPEAGCLPVDEQALTFDEASSDLARSQQLGREWSGLQEGGAECPTPSFDDLATHADETVPPADR